MNREIKFRVWDGVDYMSEPFTLQKLMLGEIEFTSECHVMQYTGLKDKNGKEIYEGDCDKDFQVVTWCKERNGWALSTYDLPTKDFIFCNCTNCEGNFDINEDLQNIEIIGNIYESEELVK